MENNDANREVVTKRLICFYCGTIYDAERGKCPLCGSTATSGVAENTPEKKDESVESEKKSSSGKGKYAKEGKKPSNVFLIAAVILLALSVCVVTYFIGDMIGFWPGLEDKVNRETENVTTVNAECTQLIIDPLTMEFSASDETQSITVKINAECEEILECGSSDPSVAVISQQGETSEGSQMKSVSFTVTSVGSGEAVLTFTCGEQMAVCTVTCAEEPIETEETVPEFYPEMNFTSPVVLTEEDAEAIVKVVNLPSGSAVQFTSSDETIITVDEDGVVTAIGEGTASVTADVRGQTATVMFEVDFSEEGPHLDDVDFYLDIDKYFRLELLDEDDDEIEDARFVIEDPTICELREERIYGLAEGTTQIIVTYRDKIYVCVVYVE